MMRAHSVLFFIIARSSSPKRPCARLSLSFSRAAHGFGMSSFVASAQSPSSMFTVAAWPFHTAWYHVQSANQSISARVHPPGTACSATRAGLTNFRSVRPEVVVRFTGMLLRDEPNTSQLMYATSPDLSATQSP
jgi:hypothetical protein